MKQTYSLVTIFLVLAIGSFEVKTTPIENQWQKGSGSTFYLKGFLPMNHTAAQDWCVLMGGNLAEPRSPEETSVINEIIGEEERTYWIGLQQVQDVWRWSSDNAGIEDYSNWCSSCPNGESENCAVIDSYLGKYWDDYLCGQISYNFPFFALCQKTL